ncbi:MAG: response regulator transcription factor [Clostridia bacterium]|nr:response regulator transcription factor [Clostridia bacterium]
MFTIMVVEDDLHLQKMMTVFLRMNGYNVLTADDGEKALEVMETAMPDLVICDIMMPRMDGYQLTRELRDAYPLLPILMVTAKETIEDKRLGYQAGTDDYMVKPIDLDELAMRVTALLRRARINTERQITIGESVLDYDALTVTRPGLTLQLTKKEFYLLFKLLSYPQQIFTRRQLMDEIWGMDAESDERTVDVHIKRLREKCEPFPEFRILTVRGLGYKAEKLV